MIRPNALCTSLIDAVFYNAQESIDNPPPFLMDQVHGAEAMILTNIPSTQPMCDALVTNKKGLQLTVKTADCAPILLADPENKIIAAVHAGWKGAFQGIIESTLLKMLSLGAKIEFICAAIGPHLTQKSFQVSPEMQSL